jgi:hypothetical protein
MPQTDRIGRGDSSRVSTRRAARTHLIIAFDLRGAGGHAISRSSMG